MLTKMLLTLGSERTISKAFLTASAVAPPPTSRKSENEGENEGQLEVEVSLFLFTTFFSTAVEETVRLTGRVSSVELEHIHGSHGESSSVNEASDVSVELWRIRKQSDNEVISFSVPCSNLVYSMVSCRSAPYLPTATRCEQGKRKGDSNSLMKFNPYLAASTSP